MNWFQRVKARWPVRRLTWNEPEAYRITEDARGEIALRKLSWLRPVMIMACIGVCLMGWAMNLLLHRIDPTNSPPHLVDNMAIGLALAWLVAYGAPVSTSFFPAASPSIQPESEKVPPTNPSDSLYKEFVGYAWSDEGTYHELRLITKKGHTLWYGVPNQIIRDQIEAVLHEAGLRRIEIRAQ